MSASLRYHPFTCMRIRRVFFILFLAAFAAASRGARQQAPEPPTPQSKSAPGSTKPKTADFSEEPIVYEYLHTSIRYENDGDGIRETRGRIHVQTTAGLSKAGQLIFNYNEDNESVEIRNVRVIDANGHVTVAGPGSIQDLSAPVAREAPMYSDARQKHVTVPAVAVGDIVEYDVVTKSKPLSQGPFWLTWFFETQSICLDEQVELNVPDGRSLKIKSPPDAQPAIQIQGDRRIYRWKTSSLSVLNVFDLMKNSKFDLATLLEGVRVPEPRHIDISTFQSWAEVGKWYASLERERRKPTADVRAEAAEIVQGKTTDVEKAQAIYNWVATNIRYVSLSFGIGRYQPHSAAEVLANRYGDCKDKATLLEALFAAEGLEANAVLINSQFDLDADVPTPAKFDHAINFVAVAGKESWVDSTLAVGPFGYLLPQLRGKDALVVFTDKAPEIRKTEKELSEKTVYHLDVSGTADPEKGLDTTVRLETRGDLEAFIRVLSSKLSVAQLSSLLDQGAAKANIAAAKNATLTDLKIETSDLSLPVKVEIHLSGTLSGEKNDSLASEESAHAFLKAMLDKDGALFLLPGAPAPSKGKTQEPMFLGGPKEYSLTLALRIPDAKPSSIEKPSHFQATSAFAEYETNSYWEGQTLHASWRLSLRNAEIPGDHIKEYAKFVQDVSGSLDLREPAPKSGSISGGRLSAAPAPALPYVPSSEAQSLFRQGQDEETLQNWANAAQKFQAALKLDDKYSDSWRELGRAHMYGLDYADAEAAFRKYLELAPDDARAYSNMSWVLYREKKFDEETALLEKRLASRPYDGDANTRLGSAYLALHEPQKAVPVLEKAVSILPKYEPAQYNLARAYLQTNQNEMAITAFTRAIALNDNPAILNDAAYELAERTTSLDTAEQWSARSISAVAIELNQVSLKNIRPRTSAFVNMAAAYWDTFGWIKFEKHDLNSAAKYVLAAWQLADDSTISFHLGRIYEAQGRENLAIDVLSQALAKLPPNQDTTDDEKEARQLLSKLAPGNMAAEAHISEARAEGRRDRTIALPNPARVQGIAQYDVLIGADSKILDIAAIGADSLASFANALRSATVPQSFPDTAVQKIPRMATLACPASDQPCAFTLLPAQTQLISVQQVAANGN